MTRRIAMWSGPRNISTTMMRSFENRADTAVTDEPLYAHYLSVTGFDHPMRDEILKAQDTDWRGVVEVLTSKSPAPVWFQKHMTQHITPDMDLGWLSSLDHFFLIREPRLMAASFAKKMAHVSADDLGLIQEWRLFEAVRALTGKTPPVIDAQDMLSDPERQLRALCGALGLNFDPAMLSWPSGSRDSDGVWAPHWYDAVTRSTGFGPPVDRMPELEGDPARAAADTQEAYKALYAHRLSD